MNSKEVFSKLSDVMRLRHLSWQTEQCYAGWIRRYIDWLTKHGSSFATSEQRMGAFLTMLTHQNYTTSTQNQTFNTTPPPHQNTPKQKLKNIKSLHTKQPTIVRYAPSKEQVMALLDETQDTHGYPTRLVVRMLYGCGLRVTEPLNLRIKDIDSAHSRLMIRGAKGGKDRVVTVPCGLMAEIAEQIKRAKLTWEDDVKAGLPVEVPGQLARKYKNAPFSWQWAWLFPSKTSCLHPRTGERVKYRMHEANVQKCVKTAAVKLGLDSALTPHCLRHAYATHVLDRGANIRDLQSALGHASLDTTMGYVHAESARVISPLA